MNIKFDGYDFKIEKQQMLVEGDIIPCTYIYLISNEEKSMPSIIVGDDINITMIELICRKIIFQFEDNNKYIKAFTDKFEEFMQYMSRNAIYIQTNMFSIKADEHNTDVSRYHIKEHLRQYKIITDSILMNPERTQLVIRGHEEP